MCWPRSMIVCNARCSPTVYVVQGRWFKATPDVFPPCVLSKGDDGMARSTYPTVGAALGPCEHATPDVLWSCVLSNGDDKMARQTSSNRVFFPRAMITYHTQHTPTVPIVQGQWWNLMPDVVWLFVLPKGYYSIAMPDVVLSCVISMGDEKWYVWHRPNVYSIQDRWWHATRNIIWPFVCFPRGMMACHARRSPTVCVVQGTLWHATLDVVRPCKLSKGDVV